MPLPGLQPIVVEAFGGLNTLVDPQDCPLTKSPDCQDITFAQGSVESRPGLTSAFTLSGTPSVNGLKTFFDLNLNRRLMVFDSLGNISVEYPEGSVSLVDSNYGTGLFMSSDTLFGRHFMCFSDGKTGQSSPVQYDGSSVYRVSQVGPGQAPVLTEVVTSVTDATNASPIVITTGTAHNVADGGLVTLSNVGGNDAANGQWYAKVTGYGSTTFALYEDELFQVPVAGNGAYTTGGTLGSISLGVHQFAVIFETATGYRTQLSPFATINATGGNRVTLTNIPVGPPNVVRRIIVASAAGDTNNFFFTTLATASGIAVNAMVLNDNATQTITQLDFDDTSLIAGESVNDLLTIQELPSQAGCVAYNSRMVFWGERNAIPRIGTTGFLNMSFDGGKTTAWVNTPLGWNQARANITNGGFAGGVNYGVSGAQGGVFRIVGDGSTEKPSCIENQVLAHTVLLPNTEYQARIRAKKSAGLTQGSVSVYTVDAVNPDPATGVIGFTVTAAQITTSFATYSGIFYTSHTTVQNPTYFRVSGGGTPTAGQYIDVDFVEVYPTNSPYNLSILRVSKVEDPESHDGLSGFVSVAENNGQAIRSCFAIRNNLYICKERSMWVTADDGQSDPDGWEVDNVSSTVGTYSINGVGLGDEWGAIAARDGLYLFGANPYSAVASTMSKMSQEIQPTWNTINWSNGHLVWVVADNKQKRVYVGVPYGSSAAAVNKLLVLDYTAGMEEEQRQWTVWAIPANSGTLAERASGNAELFFGSNDASGKVRWLDSTKHTDDGTVINSYYRTAFLTTTGAYGRHLFGYMNMAVNGSGNLDITAYLANGTTQAITTTQVLLTPEAQDMDRYIRVKTERCSFKIGTNASTDWFNVSKFVAWAIPDPYAVFKGSSP
jgi:hypothetical protein